MNIDTLILGTQQLPLLQPEEKNLTRVCYLYFWSSIAVQVVIAAATALGLFWFL